jgi:cell division protein FtsN
MPQFERRLYEPSDDIRVFDGGDDDMEEEGSRLPLLIVIALVVLASFAGVVWLAYTQGVQRGRQDAPRIIAAQPAPSKTAANAQKSPYSDLNIYQPAKPDEDGANQDSAPQPPTIIVPQSSKPAIAAPPPSMKPPATAAAPSAAPAHPLKPAGKETVPPATKPIIQPAKTAPVKLSPPATRAPRAIAPAMTPQAKPTPQAAVPQPAPARSQSIPPVTAAAPPPKAAAPTTRTAALNPAALSPTAQQPASAAQGAGGFVLQIGSYKSQAEADASWQTYKGAHPSVAGYAPDIRQAELGPKGTWYRLRVGPFTSLGEANAACAKLKAQGGSCFPAKR